MKNATIKDIAKELNLGKSTVSRILNHKGYYSKEAEQKVMEYVERTGFVYNKNAKSLKTSKSYAVGLMIPDITNPFFSQAAKMIDVFFSDQGYSIYITNSFSDVNKEREIFSNFASYQVDGIICCGFGTKIPSSFSMYQIPVVSFDREFHSSIPAVKICFDNYDMGYKLIEMLHDRGCRKILLVFLSGFHDVLENFSSVHGKKNSIFDGIVDGYRQIYNTDSPSPVLIPGDRNTDIEFQKNALREIIGSDPDFDGILCVNDTLAYCCIEVLKEMGARIPEDVKVIGFDNTVYSTISVPQITTVDRNLNEMIEVACNKLLKMINKEEEIRDETVFIKEQLIIRGSTDS